MNYLASNLKFLRKRRKKTQEDVSGTLGIPRATLNNYEGSVSEPKLTMLIQIAEYYRFRLDDLVKVDLSQIPESKLRVMEAGQ